jgi:5-methylcytosine-specific restriction endonuclease McrA
VPPTADEQIRFLVNLQRLLDEGLFVASYKFALLLSLADLSVEKGEDSGAQLTLTIEDLAEKFIQCYWRQTVPYPTAEPTVLQQNTGKQAAILNVLGTARVGHSDSLPSLMKQTVTWKRLRRDVSSIVRKMPLWKLQTVGRERLDFLYENTGTGETIELRSGVAYCFRKFHPLISDLVRGAWVRYVRHQNLDVLGETADLNEFLFGTERASLAAVRPILIDIQQGRCFYCNKSLSPSSTHVDHFIAWARYPVDLGHNFVLADGSCNSQKCDRLLACDHLERWTERNTKFGKQIEDAMQERSIIAELTVSNRIAQWAYEQTEAANGLTWMRADELVPLAANWRAFF